MVTLQCQWKYWLWVLRRRCRQTSTLSATDVDIHANNLRWVWCRHFLVTCLMSLQNENTSQQMHSEEFLHDWRYASLASWCQHWHNLFEKHSGRTVRTRVSWLKGCRFEAPKNQYCGMGSGVLITAASLVPGITWEAVMTNQTVLNWSCRYWQQRISYLQQNKLLKHNSNWEKRYICNFHIHLLNTSGRLNRVLKIWK